jgi:hypothetical protein
MGAAQSSAPPPISNVNRYEWATTTGNALMVFGTVSQSLGAYYSALSNRYQAKSMQSAQLHAAEMARLGSKMAEADAQSAMMEGGREAARAGMAYRQEKGSAQARQAAGGIVSNEGSAAEELASIQYAADTDRYQINANAVRQAGMHRMRAADAKNQELMARTNAAGIRRTERSINPYAAGHTALLTGGGQAATAYAASQERRAYYGRRG